MKIRKQIKDIGVDKIEKTLKKGGVLQFNWGDAHIEFTCVMSDHCSMFLKFREPRWLFGFTRNGMRINNFRNMDEVVDMLNELIENRTKVTLWRKTKDNTFKKVKI